MSWHALPYLAVARVGGVDAGAFLHAQLSADVAGLAEGDSTFACYCSPRGQVLGLLLVCRRREDYLLVASYELLPGLLNRLRLFVLRAKVELSMLPDPVLGAAGGGRPDSCWDPGIGLAYGVSPAISEPSASAAAAWKSEELGRGVAWLDARTTERFIPQMLGFDRIGAVSFSKGCYPGQEIVARARYLGKVKRGPLRLNVVVDDTPEALRADWPETGNGLSLLFDGVQEDATLIDYSMAADSRVQMLVVTPLADGSPREVEIGGRRYACATM